MSEKPIIFSGQMIRAILDGRKTQTRRVIKPQPKLYGGRSWSPGYWDRGRVNEGIHQHVVPNGISGTYKDNSDEIKCPYGNPGDVLWVRESFTKLDRYHVIDSEYVYKADCNPDDLEGEEIRREYIRFGYPYQWKPSIHMPRCASRINLLIKDIRVERVHDISPMDCIAEGIHRDIAAFRALWDSINSKRGYCWDSNPWVWVIEFERIQE